MSGSWELEIDVPATQSAPAPEVKPPVHNSIKHAFVCNDDGRTVLYVVTLDGRLWRRLEEPGAEWIHVPGPGWAQATEAAHGASCYCAVCPPKSL